MPCKHGHCFISPQIPENSSQGRFVSSHEPNMKVAWFCDFFSLLKKYGRLKQANLPINPTNSCLRGGWAWILFTFLVIYQGRETVRWPPKALIHLSLKYSTARRSLTHRRDANCYLCPPLLSSGKANCYLCPPLLSSGKDWLDCRCGCSDPYTQTHTHTHTHTYTHTVQESASSCWSWSFGVLETNSPCSVGVGTQD